MEYQRSNLRTIKRSRRRARAGDIFAWQMPDGLFRFGRVVWTGNVPSLGDGLALVYLYKASAESPLDVVDLLPGGLLVPPLFLGRTPWNAGVFSWVRDEPLVPRVLLETHCFWSCARDQYVDINGIPLSKPCEPCGHYALTTPGGLDREVSRALGFPLCLPDPTYLIGKDRRCFRTCKAMLESRGYCGDAAELGALRGAMICYEDIRDLADYRWPTVPGMPPDAELRQWATAYRADEDSRRNRR